MRVLLGIISLIFLIATVRAEGAADFLPGFGGVPLMPGLELIEDRSMLFDTPQGSIAEVWARGPATANELAAFYGDALPQLGWELNRRVDFADGDGLVYTREGERLVIATHTGKDTGTVSFSLSPIAAR